MNQKVEIVISKTTTKHVVVIIPDADGTEVVNNIPREELFALPAIPDTTYEYVIVLEHIRKGRTDEQLNP